jgi:F-type H+-transporting ATPase subunit b
MLIELAPDLSLIAIMVIFIAEYFVVKKFFLEPLTRVMSERENEIKTAAHRHEEALARLHEATREMDAKVGEAKKQGSQIRESFRSEASKHRADVVEQTRAEAGKIVSEADAELTTSVASARQKIEHEADALARLAAERILGRSL